MTCNQLVALACIYRGTPIPKIGTIKEDISYLKKSGLIINIGRFENTIDWMVTSKGSLRLKAALELL